MSLTGHIKDGQVILDHPADLPDGTPVTVAQQNLPMPSSDPKDRKSLSDALGDLIGSVDNLPEDFAKNHDHYIHGTPKRP